MSFLDSLSVALIGIVVVFVGLVFLIFCISVLRKVSGIERKNGKEPEQKTAEAESPAMDEVYAAEEEALNETAGDDTLIAVLSAAVAAVWNTEQGFVVRRVRRIHASSAWEKAGREEQVYSRM